MYPTQAGDRVGLALKQRCIHTQLASRSYDPVSGSQPETAGIPVSKSSTACLAPVTQIRTGEGVLFPPLECQCQYFEGPSTVRRADSRSAISQSTSDQIEWGFAIIRAAATRRRDQVQFEGDMDGTRCRKDYTILGFGDTFGVFSYFRCKIWRHILARRPRSSINATKFRAYLA